MPEKLVEADIYVADHALHSGIAGYTGQPPRSADADFEGRRRFAPRRWGWRRFLRNVVRLRSGENSGGGDEDHREHRPVKDRQPHSHLADSMSLPLKSEKN